ncbi:divalent-cation tolerance protein CutA [Novosphingobium cyanobacteriorum]|uniref:Divalent-cation tolerance protein CutA n=1 Tax=Novosphingobium cyanobacteriorum TaxID=3024215 RepID=A0ABT6CHV0_9SPHN|nr:divalent-cation tolerance protein CutA [Novosphingobium cyanobacteriorum]MDF8333500.1 divalent-cation tolerance protein CutA [Novosphingobium cyanobacteriorum]
MDEPGAALIWCPFADEASAEAVAGALLDEGLVACANILPGVRSLYRWKGARGEGREVGVLFKTTSTALARAIARLEALHPYEAPAIAGWVCDAAGSATVGWLAAEIVPD